VWQGGSDLDASKLLSTASREEGDAFSEATEFLKDMLANGPVPASQMKAEAEDADISEKTLKRAKKALNVETYRESESGESRGAGHWLWELPVLRIGPQEGQDVQEGQTQTVDPLERERGDKQPEFPIDKPNLQGGQADDLQGGQSILDTLEQRPSVVPESEWGEI
jgi:hypothetical protein